MMSIYYIYYYKFIVDICNTFCVTAYIKVFARQRRVSSNHNSSLCLRNRRAEIVIAIAIRAAIYLLLSLMSICCICFCFLGMPRQGENFNKRF